jgi:DNA-dependent RNA polymerase auxiliary subunit epsilon
MAMIFKVYYQEDLYDVPIRENTKVLYFHAESTREVRRKLADRTINIEYVQLLDPSHLEYEQKNEDFKVLEI